MTVFGLFFYVIVSVLLISIDCSEKSPNKAAAIPCFKSPSIFDYGHNFVKKIVREVKTTCSSELERLTLKLTRPSDTVISTADIEAIVTILNTEYNDPKLIVSLLVKLSRKFVEVNIHTKLKAVLSLHSLLQCQPKAQVALSKAFTSLQKEIDDKHGDVFFNKNSINVAGLAASNVAEIESVELLMRYSEYVFELIAIRGESNSNKIIKKKVDLSKNKTVMDISIVDSYLSLQSKIDSVEECCKKAKGIICMQCLDKIKEDKSWIIDELKQLCNTVDGNSLKKIQQMIKKYDGNAQSSMVKEKPVINTARSSKISLSEKSAIRIVKKPSGAKGSPTKMVEKKSVKRLPPKPSIATLKKKKPIVNKKHNK